MMWTLIIIGSSVALAAYLVWAAIKRSNRAHLLTRILASVIAIASLACLGVGVTYNSIVNNEEGAGIIIVTPGADPDSVANFTKTHTNLPVYTLDATLADKETQFVPAVAALTNGAKQTIHVFGNGLASHELEALRGFPLDYHSPSMPTGFTSISWQSEVNSGEPLIVQGKYFNKSQNNVKIILQGFSTHLDSVVVKPGATQNLELTTVPKQLGRAVYSLTVKAGEELLQEQKIPFTVLNAAPIRILVLSGTPDFENRFLKNWLFSRGYGIALRTTISRDKYHTELLNMEGSMPGRLNTGLLNNFDLVIGDATALAALGATEKSALRNAVEQQGLGVIVKADSIITTPGIYNAGVRLRGSTVNHRQQVKLVAADSSLVLPVLDMDKPNYVSGTSLVRPMFGDNEGNLYVVAAINGMGRMIHTTLNNTYSWVLHGDTMAYRKLWTSLINEVAKRKTENEVYSSSPAIPYTGAPVTIKAETSDTIPFLINVNQQPKTTTQQWLTPFEWRAMFWPHTNGWQQVTTRDNITKHFYVYSKSEWTGIQARQTIEENSVRTAATVDNVKLTEVEARQVKKEIPKIYFFIIFIISCAYLWIEEKFFSRGA